MLEYKLDVEIKGTDFNEDGNIKLSSLLFFFQEAATQHADVIGIGMDALLEKNIIWVLTKMKVRITGKLTAGSGYYVMTYPRAVKSRFCPRDYYLYNSDDQLVAVGSGMWSLVDWTTRKVIRATDVDFGGTFREDEAFPEGFEKVRMTEPEQVSEYTVRAEDIDANMHTNNCRYADMMNMAAADVSEVKEFVIQFSKETKEGDVIKLFRETADDAQLVGGKLADGQTVFTARITF